MNKKKHGNGKPIKVVVTGALGRAGKATVGILCGEPGIDVVGVVDALFFENELPLPHGKGRIPASTNLEHILDRCQPDVLVDFTNPSATMLAVRASAKRGIHVVIGTTGLSNNQLNQIHRIAKPAGIGVLTGSLSFGVALAAHLASIAAKYFDCAEILDLGKFEKLDAPSGAALDIAKAMAKVRGKPFNLPQGQKESPACRGGQYDGVTVHSVRLSDCYIHEQVIFGTSAGTLLSIGLELTSAEYLKPGIVIAVKEAPKHKGLVYGLDDFFLGFKKEKQRRK
jgi:4-hydroxy-tetrahydrodipicolinate reductase